MKNGGKRPGAGRPKGALGKHTTDLKDMIRQALDGVGGVDYLKTQAFANPTAFLSLLGKTLPPAASTFDGELRVIREIRVMFVEHAGQQRHIELENPDNLQAIMQ